MEKKRSLQKWLWYFSLIGALILLYKLTGNIRQVWDTLGWLTRILSPFIGGFALAFLLWGPCRRLEGLILRGRRRIWQRVARPLSLVIVYLLLFGILTLVIYLVMPRLITSLVGLITSLPDYLRHAKERFDEAVSQEGLLGRFQLGANVDAVYDSLLQKLKNQLTVDNVMSALQGVVSVTSSIVNAIIAVMVSVYMLAGRERLMRDCRAVCGMFIKPAVMQTLADYIHRTAAIFYSYFYGAFVDALVVGVVVSVGLSIFRVPYAVLLGMTLGLMNMIPYFGAMIGGAGVVLITLLSKNIYAALGVALYIVVVQQVDGNIIQPRVVGDSVGLRPIYVLLGITLFGGLFGFWGIFLGVPLMAIIQMIVKDIILRRQLRSASGSAVPRHPTS